MYKNISILAPSHVQCDYVMAFLVHLDDDCELKQCYQMAESEDYDIDGDMLDEIFEKLAVEIRKSEKFESEKLNVVTFIVEHTSVKVEFKAYGKETSLYKIKKSGKVKKLNRGSREKATQFCLTKPIKGFAINSWLRQMLIEIIIVTRKGSGLYGGEINMGADSEEISQSVDRACGCPI